MSPVMPGMFMGPSGNRAGRRRQAAKLALEERQVEQNKRRIAKRALKDQKKRKADLAKREAEAPAMGIGMANARHRESRFKDKK